MSANNDLYKKLNVSLGDLQQARWYARHLLKKGWHVLPWERRGAVYLHQSAYTTSLVISYQRPFSQSSMRAKLPADIISDFTEHEHALHADLKRRRDKIYAHSDNSEHVVNVCKLDGEIVDIELEPFRRLTKDELDLVEGMTTKLISKMNACKAALAAGIFGDDADLIHVVL